MMGDIISEWWADNGRNRWATSCWNRWATWLGIINARTANIEVRKWLRDVANVRVVGGVKIVPAEAWAVDREELLALPKPYIGLTKRQASDGPSRPSLIDLPSIQRPLAAYDALLTRGVA
ncbi:MAG TPA: hypothetical protein VM659_21575 [Dongiaceae bacterium]|nr:hypothetical protein [Dongiaceae bacterium]